MTEDDTNPKNLSNEELAKVQGGITLDNGLKKESNITLDNGLKKESNITLDNGLKKESNITLDNGLKKENVWAPDRDGGSVFEPNDKD
jgi:bacteriocin-like protein